MAEDWSHCQSSSLLSCRYPLCSCVYFCLWPWREGNVCSMLDFLLPFHGIRCTNLYEVFAYVPLYLEVFFGSRDTPNVYYNSSLMPLLLENVIDRQMSVKTPVNVLRVFSLIVTFFNGVGISELR